MAWQLPLSFLFSLSLLIARVLAATPIESERDSSSNSAVIDETCNPDTLAAFLKGTRDVVIGVYDRDYNDHVGIKFRSRLSRTLGLAPSEVIICPSEPDIDRQHQGGLVTLRVGFSDPSNLHALDALVEQYHTCVVDANGDEAALLECDSLVGFPLDYAAGPISQPRQYSQRAVSQHQAKKHANAAEHAHSDSRKGRPALLPDPANFEHDLITRLTKLREENGLNDTHHDHDRKLSATCTGYQFCRAVGPFQCMTDAECLGLYMQPCSVAFGFLFADDLCHNAFNCDVYDYDYGDCPPALTMQTCTDGYQVCGTSGSDAGACMSDDDCVDSWGVDCTTAASQSRSNGVCDTNFACPAYDYDGLDCDFVPNSERQALVDFYWYHSGPSWVRSDRWLSEAGVCSWHGVTCNTDKTHVMELRLNANGLALNASYTDGTSRSGAFKKHTPGHVDHREVRRHRVHVRTLKNLASYTEPEEERAGVAKTVDKDSIPRPANLERRRVVEAHLRAGTTESPTFLPDSFTAFQNLKVLDIGGNAFDGCTIPAAISELTSLTHLGLYASGLVGSLPESMSTLPALTHFSAGHGVHHCAGFFATFHCSIPFGTVPLPLGLMSVSQYFPRLNYLSGSLDPILQIPTLAYLSVEMNLFTSQPFPEFLCENLNLKYYSPSANPMAGPLPECVAETNIEVLALSATDLYGSSLPLELGSTSLVRLLVGESNMTGPLPQSYPVMLEELHGPATPFATTIPSAICEHKFLTLINVAETYMSGTIPACLSTNTAMVVLIISGNALTGTLPDFSPLMGLVFLGMDANQLSGPLPHSSIGWPNLAVASFSSNNFEGTIPPEIFALASHLQTVGMSLLPSLTGTIPSVVATSPTLTTLAMSVNSLNGSFPASLCGIALLKSLDLSYNQLSGSLPDCFNGMTSLKLLNLESNNFTGSIPASIGECANLKVALLTLNSLSGTTPDSFAKLTNLATISLAHNLFNETLHRMVAPLIRLPDLANLDVSGNMLYGILAPETFLSPADVSAFWPSLETLLLDENQLEGPINKMSYMTSLRVLDISNNKFTGAIPDSFGSLLALRATGNPYLRSCSSSSSSLCGRVPAFAVLSGDYISQGDALYSCPIFTGLRHDMDFEIDPEYYNRTLCKCRILAYGQGGYCQSCLAGGTCEGGTEAVAWELPDTNTTVSIPILQALTKQYLIPSYLIANPGYYPSPSVENPKYLVECNRETLTTTMCNPDEDTAFQCKEGYEGRICSECSVGYYANGRQCQKCPEQGASVVILIVVIVFIVYVSLLVFVKHKRYLRVEDYMKPFLFYTQTINLFMSGTRLQYTHSLLIFDKIYGYFNLNASILWCVKDSVMSTIDEFSHTLALPGYGLVGSIILYAVVYFWRKIRGHKVDHEVLRNETIHYYIFFINFTYLPIVFRVLQVFRCVDDPGLDKKFMDSKPWTECDEDGDWGAMRKAAIVYIPLFIVAVPVLLTACLYYNRNSLNDPKVYTRYCALYYSYKPEYYWYEMLTVVRRILLSFAVSMYWDDLYPPYVLGMVILVSAAIQVGMSPFESVSQNVLENAAHWVIILTYVTGLLFTLDFADHDSVAVKIIEIVTIIANFAMALVNVYILIRFTCLPGDDFLPYNLHERIIAKLVALGIIADKAPKPYHQTREIVELNNEAQEPSQFQALSRQPSLESGDLVYGGAPNRDYSLGGSLAIAEVSLTSLESHPAPVNSTYSEKLTRKASGKGLAPAVPFEANVDKDSRNATIVTLI